MSLEQRRGQFKLHIDVVFSNDPAVETFFRQVRVYSAKKRRDVVHYRATSMVFDEIESHALEPVYDLYMEDGVLHAERSEFDQETRYA